MSTNRSLLRNITGSLLLLMLALFVFAMYTAINKAIESERQHTCVWKMVNVGRGAFEYAKVHTNQFPHAATWCDDIKPWAFDEKFYLCPSAKPELKCHYAFNAKLSGLNPTNVHPETVMFFETAGGWNVSGGPELAIPRHESYVVTLADCSTLSMNETRFKALRWEP